MSFCYLLIWRQLGHSTSTHPARLRGQWINTQNGKHLLVFRNYPSKLVTPASRLFQDEKNKITANSALWCTATQALFASRFSHPPSWLMPLYVSVHTNSGIGESCTAFEQLGHLRTVNIIETKPSKTKAMPIFGCQIWLLIMLLLCHLSGNVW